MTDTALLSATETRRRIGAGELTAVRSVEAALDRVVTLNESINAVVTLSVTALEEARALDERLAAGEAPGLLHGLTVGIKDVTPVAGLRTTFGSPLYADHVPAEDALVVRRLREAGAVILGKTNAPEFATGGNTFNEVFGVTRNPWDPTRSAGGSTGGGAAGLATGMIALAEGTDLGGSLRIPASFCGVVGLRPSAGLVPTYPSDFLWDSYQVTGPMARTAEDVALMLQAVAGPSALSPMRQPTRGRDFIGAVRAGPKEGLRVAYCADITGIGIDREVSATCSAAIEALASAGVEVEEVELDLSGARKPFLALRGLWMIAQQHSRLEHLEAFGANLAGNVRAGLETSTVEIAAAESVRAGLWSTFHDLFQDFDHLLTPCMAVAPFPADQNYPQTVGGQEMETYIDWVAPTFVLSMTGLPVASVPAGLDPSGLPVGLQIVGRPEGEEEVLALAEQIQQLRPIGVPQAR